MSLPSIYKLNNIFESSESCISYLLEKNILYQEIKCPKHKKSMVRNKKMWRCTKRDCTKEASIFNYSLLYIQHN